jgi:pimeloyl-ACP methyl ester carboxylesterase
MWREQIEFLAAAGYRVIAPDFRGLGETTASAADSDRKPKPMLLTTMEDFARDIDALMEELKIERTIICGLSMGAYVAFELMHLFPSRVRGLVLAGARADAADEAEKQMREQQAARALAEGMDYAVDAILMNLLAPVTLADKPEVVARVREMILRTNPRGAAAAQRGMAARRDYSGELSSIDVPTLIIAGRDDAVRKPHDAERIHGGIKDSRLEIIDDAGHLMNMEQPEVFNTALSAFIQSLN